MDRDTLRGMFSTAMSAMYRREVPQYGTLLELVASINRRTRPEGPDGTATPAEVSAHARLGHERHGAIRVGTPDEMRLLRRMFAVLGMAPVGYYDLSAAGLPVHSTGFRATGRASLDRSPFRLFASLLRPEMIADAALRAQAASILARRRIVTPRALELIELFEAEGGLDGAQGEAFIAEALHSFRWHADATVDAATYAALHAAHPLVADIVCFKGPHINHLTPRVLDIDAAQAAMQAHGLEAKAVIEGPPRRACPILLRQTSFRALPEPVRFGPVAASHTARFGEIEQRGVALTPAGRALYDRLLARGDPAAFAAFPDDHETLRAQGLAFYRAVPTADGPVLAEPILYEDFLPVSAAGIFRSNLGAASGESLPAVPRQDALEDALGCGILDPMALYAAQSDVPGAAVAP